MIIRRMTVDDAVESSTIFSEVYGVKPYGMEGAVSSIKENLVLGCFADGDKTLMSQIIAEDYRSFFGNSILKCAAVGSVSTRPQYRNMGSVRKLFNEMFNKYADDYGWEISALHPFSVAYYRKFGYESAGRRSKLIFDFSELSNLPINNSVELYDGSQSNELFRTYNRSAEKFNLAFRRNSNRHFFAKPYEDLNYVYLWKNKDGKVKGYVTIHHGEEILYVSEFMYEDREAIVGLLGFLRSFGGQYKQLFFERLPFNSKIINFVTSPDKIKQKCFDLGMVRILDVKSVLQKKKYPEAPGHFNVKIIDTIEKNNGVFSVEYGDGQVEVKKNDNLKADIIFDICAASKILLTGIEDFNAVEYENGIIVENNNEDFFRAFKKEKTFFLDRF